MRGIRADTPGGDPILDGVDLDVPAGGTVAVLGTTGSGKSTLLALVNRLRDAGGGSVEVAGVPVSDVEIGSLRRAVGTATDDNFLFSGTVRENIAFARPDASLEDVEAAARAAQAHDFIAALPDGYDTVLGDRGSVSREASVNESRWRGRSCPARRCCCSTTRPATSTR